MFSDPKISVFFGRIFVLLLACFVGLGVASQEGCSCDPSPSKDGGEQPTKPENSGPFPTSIKFITPVSGGIISGQISIEVEVLDGDGIKEVAFVINGKPYRKVDTTSKNSTKESPRYAIQAATSFLPRGVMNIQVKTEDNRGDKAEKIIQVKTREKWVAAFGVGHIEQLETRSDKHIYLRVHRTEGDISRVTNPGPNDKVGSVIITANPIGSASWNFFELGHQFSPLSLDEKGNLYMGSRHLAKGTNRLLMVGPGESKWGPDIPIKPKWETDLKEWTVKSKPLLFGEYVWVHLEKPAQGGKPTVSALAKFDKKTGKEIKRFTGKEDFQILRGPFSFGGGKFLFVARKAGVTGPGFTVQIVGADGNSVWSKFYADWRLTEAVFHSAKSLLFFGVEKRANNEVAAAAVICIDPVGQKENWNVGSDKNLPSKLATGQNLLSVIHHSTGTEKELVVYHVGDGKVAWRKPYKKHLISGIHAFAQDAVIVFSAILDDFNDPLNMQVDRYDAKGNINWSYTNKQYFPKSWLISSDTKQTLWMIVRNIQDSREQLGTKMLTLDGKGQRLFLFFDESRSNQFMRYVGKDLFLLTSTDERDARIHNLIAR